MTTASCCSPTLLSNTPNAARSTAAGLRWPRGLPAHPVPLQRPAWSRVLHAVMEAWTGAVAARRAAAQRNAEWRTIAALDRHVLKDIGLGDFVSEQPALRWQDLERLRW